MSSRGTPKKTTSRRKTLLKRPPNPKSPRKLREERERRNAERAPKKPDHWSKMEEVLNHLALVGLRDGVPLAIQQALKQKLTASRRAVQRRADPLDITKPLLDLSDFIGENEVKTGTVIKRHLSGIRFFMEEATKEKPEDRTNETQNTLPMKKDIKGIEMKKMLDRAKGILSQLSDMNELKLTIKNSVETILKNTGYMMDTPASGIYRMEPESDKWGLKENVTESEVTPKNCNWKKIEGILDHVMRVCQRPNIAAELQQVMMSKVCASRKFFLRKSDPISICKPLHELIDVLNHHGLQSSEVAKNHMEEIHTLSTSKVDNEEDSSMTSGQEKNCLEVRKALGQAKSCLNYLSELNELKMIIKNSADLIQRGGSYTAEELPSLLTDLEDDTVWDVSGMVRAIEKMSLPNNLKVSVKVTMARLRKILATPTGNTFLQEHLENLRDSLKRRIPEEVAMACYSLMAAVTDFQKSHWNSD